jgi:Cd2+/Zn2+-exporting ATPase
MRQIYHLQGLDCASCAQKIEVAAGKLNNVKKAVVDFPTSRIILDTHKDAQKEDIKSALSEIVAALEPGVLVSEAPTPKVRVDVLTGRNLAFAAGLLSFFTALFLPAGLGKNGLILLAYFLAGWEIILQAGKNIIQGQIFDENFLMTIATLGALAIGELPEAASVMLFYRTGEFLQGLAVDHSRRSIQALIAIKPQIAHRKQGEQLVDVPVVDVKVGDVLFVLPGERIPVDGIILDGSSSLDASALTGESLARPVETGEEVLAGCINLSGLLTIEATKEAAQSAVARILDLVENAAANKAPTEDFITSFARYYTPAVVGAAALIAAIPPLFFAASFESWFYRALVFLVISCPCALVVSIPLGFFGGIGRASKQGILVKGSNYLQALHEADTVVFDKTGTLTSGDFTVQRVEAEPPFTEEEVLAAAAHGESFSSHPIARSIAAAYGQEIALSEVSEVEELTGLGVKARWQDREILVGSARFLAQAGIEMEAVGSFSGVYVAIDGKRAGIIWLSDSPKPGAIEAVQRLKQLGKRVIMLTGDSASAAQGTAAALGIHEFHAELLPEQKVEQVDAIIQNSDGKSKVVFVGDGINDAPALARAHVGVAMGALGSEAAVETADVVLMTDNPFAVVEAMETAGKTNRIVWQNINLALVVKVVVLLLGAVSAVSLWQAVFADVGVTILTVLNSMRIIRAVRD